MVEYFKLVSAKAAQIVDALRAYGSLKEILAHAEEIANLVKQVSEKGSEEEAFPLDIWGSASTSYYSTLKTADKVAWKAPLSAGGVAKLIKSFLAVTRTAEGWSEFVSDACIKALSSVGEAYQQWYRNLRNVDLNKVEEEMRAVILAHFRPLSSDEVESETEAN
jgi:hypothetical protein